MPEKIQLSIDTPCHEQWDDMQPDSTGRFCGSCQKTVVDFTMMSDQEVLTWFSKASGSVCGRLHTDQMHRDIVPPAPIKRNRWAIWWQLLLAGVMVSSKASAQGKVSVVPVTQTIDLRKALETKMPICGLASPRIPTTADTLRGTLGAVSFRPVSVKNSPLIIKVADSVSGEPVPSATVRVGSNGFVTDETGSISIKLKQFARAGSIEVTYVGYEKKIVGLNEMVRHGNTFTIQLSRSPGIMGDVEVVGHYTLTPRTLLTGAVAICTIKTTTLKDTLSSWLVKAPVTVYPNPVSRGASVTVSLGKLKPGDYTIQLFDNAGALMETMRIEGLNGPRTELLPLPGTLAAGMYFVKIANTTSGKVYTQKLSVL